MKNVISAKSALAQLPLLPADPILKLPIAFRNDPRTHKINLGVGAYRDAHGAPWVLPSVREAEKQLFAQNLNKEYLPIEGDPLFLSSFDRLLFNNLLFGDKIPPHISVQTVGGSAALRIGAELLLKAYQKPLIFLSQPTWPNHAQIFEAVGFEVAYYPYAHQHELLFKEMLTAINAMPSGSILLLQTSCHNPTGIDPTPQQWEEICKAVKKRNLIPFFDSAYHGFGADLKEDLSPFYLFAKEGIDCLISYSFAKNMGLYGERLGALTVCVDNENLLSQLRRIIRTLYSSPPLHGARIAHALLSTPALRLQWEKELEQMRQRIQTMRDALAQALQMEAIRNHKGMFSYSGLNRQQVQQLIQEYAIYMPDDGRINFAGLIPSQIETVTHAIQSVRGLA